MKELAVLHRKVLHMLHAAGLNMYCSKFQVRGSRCGMCGGVRCGVWGMGRGVWGVGSGVWGVGCGVWGAG